MCFFCKQKTAYEMRISDWSSDVCSSDLTGEPAENWSAPTCDCGHDSVRSLHGAARLLLHPTHCCCDCCLCQCVLQLALCSRARGCLDDLFGSDFSKIGRAHV